MRIPLTIGCHDEDMNTSTRLTATTALALTLSLGLAACGDDEPDVETPAEEPVASAPADGGSDDGSDAGGEDDAGETTTDSDDSSASDDDSTASDDAADSSAPGGEASDDVTASVLAAIATAEAETGGTAYETDDQDEDGTWEIDVRVDDRSIEVTVSADGSEVIRTEEENLDAEDRDALDAATITITDAIQIALDEVGGTLDDAELETDHGEQYWEVTIDVDETRSVEVLVSVTGEVLGTDN